MPSLRDLGPLFALHFALLILTLLLGPGNLADVRVQLVWTAFLTLGWAVAPTWIGNHASIIRRYLAAMISAIALHGVLAMLGSLSGFGMHAYLAIWIGTTLVVIFHRANSLASDPRITNRIPLRHLLLIAAIILFVVCVYRTPRSNDIHQFLLQQQDMLAELSLQVSSIGMSAMDVDQPMPRWKAHYWHLLPGIIAHASGIAVDQVLLRYATIPIAFSVLLCLTEIVRSLAGKRVTYPIVLIAILGPVLLGYRNFNAFNYSFRVTNNLLLDKDFALFWLVPAAVWLAVGWIQGRRRYLIPLIGLVPALIRFHPLTAVYLVLLAAPVAVLAARVNRVYLRRTSLLIASTFALFFVVVLIGDAQSNHGQIREIVEMDYQQSLNGQPLHYWVGFYNTIPDTNLPSDTTQWTGQRFHLKSSLITGCGLLLALHAGLFVLAACWMIGKRGILVQRVFLSGIVTVAMLWGIRLVSGNFLTRFPQYAGGYERLHWFSYTIALVVIAAAIASAVPRRGRCAIGLMILLGIVVSAAFYRFEKVSPLVHIRGLNSLLNAEVTVAGERRLHWDSIRPARSLTDLRPDYLEPTDRALLLDPRATKHYALTHQGVFWSDPYVEAFAWFHRGDDFLTDRRFFYDLLDRKNPDGLAHWIGEKRVTLIVDLRDGGDAFLAELAESQGLPMRRIEKGVWRVDR